MAHLVSQATQENPVDLVPKVSLEIVMVILEDKELKDSQEIQASQVVKAMMVPQVRTASQEVQVFLE